MITVIYCRNHKIGSWLIRFATIGKYSHCGVVIGDEVIHSTSTGVHATPLEDFLQAYSTTTIVRIACPDDKAAEAFLEAQISKPYDFTALLGIFFHRNWQEDDSWFCSELVEAALTAGGCKRFRSDIHRITPHESWIVL